MISDMSCRILHSPMDLPLHYKKENMILDKLTSIELEVKSNIYNEQNKLVAIKTLQVLLDQIDFNVEIVPMENIEKLSRLLNSLKGRALNEEERELLSRLIE